MNEVAEKWFEHIFGTTEILKTSHNDADETKIPMRKTLFSKPTVINTNHINHTQKCRDFKYKSHKSRMSHA